MVHPHLSRQLTRIGLSADHPPDTAQRWQALLDRVSAAYRDSEQDRYLMERSLAISSKEMRDLHLQLAAERDLLRTIVSTLTDAVCAIDNDGSVIFLNPEASRLFGIDERDSVGKTFSDLVDIRVEGGARFDPRVDGVATGRRVFIAANSRSYIQCFVAILSGAKPGAMVVCRDITAQKQAEIQVSQSQKLESIGQLAAGIAHEINTPTQYLGDNARFIGDNLPAIFALLGAYERATASAPMSDETRQELADAAHAADLAFLRAEMPRAVAQSIDGVSRISAIVRAMKEFSHPGSEEKEPADLNEAIRSTTIVCRHRWKYVADLELDLDPNLPKIPLMLSAINQVTLNLVVNAADAIEEARNRFPDRVGKIRVSTRMDGDDVVIEVEDNGVGIPEEHHARLFEHFFTTKPVGSGTGLGLPICHDAVTKTHAGSITFTTVPDEGTTFFVRLPLYPESNARSGSIAA